MQTGNISGVCGTNITIQFASAGNLTKLQITLLISSSNTVSKIMFNSSAHNSTFKAGTLVCCPVQMHAKLVPHAHRTQTNFGGSSWKGSFACNGTFNYAHAWDTLTITNVVFQAAIPPGGALSPPGVSTP